MNDIQVPARTGLPAHTRLILASEDLLEQWGTRDERGYAITVEWGEQRPEGWYEPLFTVHNDQPLPTWLTLRTAVEAYIAARDAYVQCEDDESDEPCSHWHDQHDAFDALRAAADAPR